MSWLGEAIEVLGSKAKGFLPKLLSGEISTTAVMSGEGALRRSGMFGDVLVDTMKQWQDKSAQQSGAYYSELLRSMKPHLKDKAITGDLATHWQNFQNLPDGPLKESITKAKMARLHLYDSLCKAWVKTG